MMVINQWNVTPLKTIASVQVDLDVVHVGVNITTLVLKNIQIDDHATGHVESFCHDSLLDYKCIKG